MLTLLLISLLRLNVATPVSGEYVEARTASVFAGPCHYNSESMTTGRDAVMALSIEHGSWNGVDLSNVRLAVAVTSQANLSDSTAFHHCEIQIDPSATDAQANAAVEWLTARSSNAFGQIDRVRRAPVRFEQSGERVTFAADGFASATVQSMPNHECCKQPNLVWYTPLIPLPHRMVGYTVQAKYSAGTLSDQWDRSDENSAFYGHF